MARDVGETAEFLSSLGLRPWQKYLLSSPKDKSTVGEPYKLKVAWSKLWGKVVLEVIKPLDDASLWARFLKTNGEGVHHIAFCVSTWDEMVSEPKERGGRLMVGGTHEGKRWGYMDTKPGGIIIEFMEDRSA